MGQTKKLNSFPDHMLMESTIRRNDFKAIIPSSLDMDLCYGRPVSVDNTVDMIPKPT
jgi:hypothetical protein